MAEAPPKRFKPCPCAGFSLDRSGVWQPDPIVNSTADIELRLLTKGKYEDRLTILKSLNGRWRSFIYYRKGMDYGVVLNRPINPKQYFQYELPTPNTETLFSKLDSMGVFDLNAERSKRFPEPDACKFEFKIGTKTGAINFPYPDVVNGNPNLPDLQIEKQMLDLFHDLTKKHFPQSWRDY
ncbi:hypothetical protein GCM10028827_03200 [Mucilaginibacter myungsuensis]